ncbi:MAG TPA: 2-dehydropantoate 2-reductase N-terminal domain-containing protein, partial [Gemmatimonadaceae bacterium]|nr:2-dehydropantoate 2-reductase N-terminal domain-containing protein [Gemmatimonadaceae bacterium]
MRCAVVGAGAWGTALADLLASNGNETVIWAHEPDVAQSIDECHENRRFLAGQALAASLRATTDYGIALDGATLVVYATPSQHLRRIAREGARHVDPRAILVVASKGVEHGTLALMTDVVISQ